MKLKKYLKERKITQEEFSKATGVSRSTIVSILRGTKKDLKLSVGLVIEGATGGLVTCSELLSAEQMAKIKRLIGEYGSKIRRG